MLQKLILLLSCIYIVIISSCAVAYLPAIGEFNNSEINPFYTSDDPNMTMLSNEKDLKLDLNRTGDHQNFPLNFKLGYSPKKHFGIHLDHHNTGKDDSDSKPWNYHMTNLAGGAYYLFQNKKHKAVAAKNTNFPVGFLLESYLGYGIGKNTTRFFKGGEIDLKVQKIFLHAGIHYHHQLLGFSLVTKINNVHFLNGQLNGNVDDRHLFGFVNLREKNNYRTVESSAKISVGTKAIMFYTGLTFNHSFYDLNMPNKGSKGYVGILLNLNSVWEKIK